MTIFDSFYLCECLIFIFPFCCNKYYLNNVGIYTGDGCEDILKVTVHVGAVQNFEIEIFAENKYTLNELLVKKNVFNTSNSLRDMTNESFYRK